MTNFAFIGLGHMGGRMAPHFVKAGHEVFAFDLSPEAMARAKDSGCRTAKSAAAAVQEAEVVITVLPGGKDVSALYSEEILPNAYARALLIDCSTIDVETARMVGAAAQKRGYRFADAPVSGGTAAAAAGALTFMAGCGSDVFADVEAALAPMAKAVIHAGDVGAGQAAKICNNMLLGISMIGLCESFALAERLGLDPERFFDIASKSSGQCWSLTAYCPWPGVGPEAASDNSYEPGFSSAMMLKDLKLAQEAAARSGAATPLGAQAEATYALFDRLGFAGKDFSAVLQMLRGNLEALK